MEELVKMVSMIIPVHECVAGFTDKNCSTNIDECSPNPCLNGGTCTDGINDYTCECVAGLVSRASLLFNYVGV